MFGLVILALALTNVAPKDFSTGVKPIGVYGSQLECEKAAAVIQQGLTTGQTAVCGKIK